MMKSTILDGWPQLGGGVRYLVGVADGEADIEVTVDMNRQGGLSAFVRRCEPPNAAELRKSACNAVRDQYR